jgi:N-acetylneuraminate lyase
MKEIQKIKGLIAAPFTPFLKNGEINASQIKPYAQKLKSENVSGVFVCGTTGEGMFLTTAERKNIAETWINEQSKDFKVIVHVGSTSVKEASDLANHAQKTGAFAVGCIGPVFLKPARLNELILFCKEVASASPQLPFYYYHIPSVSGINFSMKEFIEQASRSIPNFAGIKFTDNNFMEMQNCLNLDNGKWDILHGFDEVLLAGLSFGITGAVGSTYNYAAPLYLKLMEEFKNGKLENARKIQYQSVVLVRVLLKYGGALVAGKTIMKFQGIDCGPCRLPLGNLSPENEVKLYEALKALHLNLFHS